MLSIILTEGTIIFYILVYIFAAAIIIEIIKAILKGFKKIIYKVAYFFVTMAVLYFGYFFIKNSMYVYLLGMLVVLISIRIFSKILLRKRMIDNERENNEDSWEDFVNQYADNEKDKKRERYQKEQDQYGEQQEKWRNNQDHYEKQYNRNYENQEIDNSYRWFDNLSANEAKKKYHELMKKYHPDNTTTGNTDLAQEIQAAYDLYMEGHGIG